MAYTVNKKDMRQFMKIIFPKGWGGHDKDIYEDLIGAFEDNTEYTLENILQAFAIRDHDPNKGRRMTVDEACKLGLVYGEYIFAGGKRVKYADYLFPMFYISLVIKLSGNLKVQRDVAGRIFDDISDVFKPPKTGWEKNYQEWYGDNWRYWGSRWLKPHMGTPLHFTLTESEHEKSDEVYNIYLRVKMGLE